MQKYLEDRKIKWHEHTKILKKNYINRFNLIRLYYFNVQVNYRTQLDLELFKFRPSLKVPMSIVALRILGIFVGIYEDDMKLREHGSVIPTELPFPIIMYRFLKVYSHIWFISNFQLNLKEFKDAEINGQNFEIAKYKEDLLKAYQIDNYLKKRNKMFDFTQLCEKENFISTEI